MVNVKIAKMAAFSQDFLSEDDFEDVIAIFCSYDYGANASDAVEKVSIDEKGYYKCSL